MIKSSIKKILRATDSIVQKNTGQHRVDSPGLLILTFHGTFERSQDAYCGDVDPQQAITIAHLREAIESMLEAGYCFVGTDSVRYLEPSRHWTMLTFDDGMATNQLVLPLLEEFKIPGVFFVCTGHVEHQKAYWWDVVYRNRKRQGVSDSAIAEEVKELKLLRMSEIEQRLRDDFGPRAMRVLGDLDRAMTVTELKKFASSPWVRIGNHTRDHAILTVLSPGEIEDQVVSAQDSLEAWIGLRPTTIAYPNGNSSPEIRSQMRSLGLLQGQTVRALKSSLPIHDLYALPRVTLWGQRSIQDQLQEARCGVSLIETLRR